MNGHTRELARFISETSYSDLSENLRACIAKYFLDALGCGLYGTTTESGRILSRFVQEQGGSEEATLWRSAWRGPVGPVALCLGTWMHAFELDDYHSGAKLHPGAVVFAAAYPLAEKLGASGRMFMTACAVGYETMIRASIAADCLEVRRRGFHLTGLCGPFGAAAAAAHLMGLNPEQTANALGLAGTQGAGTWAFQCDGSETKRFHAGRAAQSGLMAASLAQGGYTGPKEIFEYEDGGFIRVFSGCGDPEPLTRDLGAHWEAEGVSFKPYCCCGSTHSTIDAVLALRREHGVAPDDVQEMEIMNHSVVKQQCSWRYEPVSSLRAQMNIEYCAAVALTDGEAGPGQFTPERIADPELVGLARRARFTVDPEIEQLYPKTFPAKVAIRTRDGRELKSHVAGPKGSPQNPMDFDMVAGKFRQITGGVIPPDEQDMLIEAASGLDDTETMGALVAHLA
ncbi:MAG: MmgE/PrpD family protein [Nitrospinae bacterium]|nr:MmgE/PrpD family protein [Nitrospinota bacterium]